MPSNLIDRLRAEANAIGDTADVELRMLLTDAAKEVEHLTERLTRLSLGADAVIKADQSGTAGDKNNAMGRLIGALYRAKDEGPGVRGAIEEVDQLKAQNEHMRGILEDARAALRHYAQGQAESDIEEIEIALSETPAQSLSEIRVQAVEEALLKLAADLRRDKSSGITVKGLIHEAGRARTSGRGGSGYDREVLGQNNEQEVQHG